MEEIKEYVFYTILKDFTGDKYKDTGISYGIKKGPQISHEYYFNAFLNIDFFPWEGLELSRDWPTSLEIMAADGNVMIANSSPEVEDLKERMYLIYLPESPTLFQLLFLEHILDEFHDLSFDVGTYGSHRKEFLEIRGKEDFNSHTFLAEYIKNNKERLSNDNLKLKKVMPQA